MKKTLLALAASTILATPAFATVIDFESTGTRGAYNNLDYAIDGFRFNHTMDNIDVSANGIWSFAGPAHSGSFAALNNYAGVGEITRADGGTFTFNSLWVKNWFSVGDKEGSVLGLRDGAVVASVAATSHNAEWNQTIGNFTDIDTLRVDLGNIIFVLDDIALNEATGKVPEPASLALLGLGAAGLLSARRKSRKA